MIEYFNEDCMVGMVRYPDKYFDLAIVDPPYGLDASSTQGKGKLKNRALNQGDISKRWDTSPPPAYFEELFRVSKEQIIWGGNYFNLPPSRGFVVWDKKQPWPNFSRAEFAWLSMQVPSKIFEKGNNAPGKIHPTQKPIDLYKFLLETYAKPGFKILDTHVGSASSLIACYDMGFDAVGFELDPDHYKQSSERLQRVMNQVTFEDLINAE